MKKLHRYRLFFILLTAALTTALAACKKEAAPERFGSVQLAFENTVNGQHLELSSGSYTNAHGDAFTVTAFKYYISNIRLLKTDGSEYIQPESYYLVDQAVPATKTLTLQNIPAGTYTGVSFLIGVDSTRNVSGAQTGALDPLHGMFWTWNSGYIFLKLEGTSPQAPEGNLTYHIGGFRSPNNTIRTVSPDFNGKQFTIGPAGTPHLMFKADVAELFRSPNPISFSELPAAMGGPAAVKVADNYTTMFRLDQVHE